MGGLWFFYPFLIGCLLLLKQDFSCNLVYYITIFPKYIQPRPGPLHAWVYSINGPISISTLTFALLTSALFLATCLAVYAELTLKIHSQKTEGINMHKQLAAHLFGQREALLHDWFNSIRAEDSVHYRAKTDAELLPSLGKIFDAVVTYLDTGFITEVDTQIQQLVGRRTQEMYVLDELLMLFSTLRQTCFEECMRIFTTKPNDLYEALSAFTVIMEKCRVKAAITYVIKQKEIIDAQHRALELSTPVLPIDDHIIIVPLIGTVDSQRANQFTEAVLNSIIEYQVDVVIIDITGVPLVDTQVANHLIKTVQASGLLGAKCILVGLRPEIAQTIVNLGIEFEHIITTGNLKKGFTLAKTLISDLTGK